MTATLGADVIRASDGSGPVSFPDGILTETVNGVAPGALDTVAARNAAIAAAVVNPIGGYTRVIVVDGGGNGNYTTLSAAVAAGAFAGASVTNRFAVVIFGNIAEVDDFTLPDFVDLAGIGYAAITMTALKFMTIGTGSISSVTKISNVSMLAAASTTTTGVIIGSDSVTFENCLIRCAVKDVTGITNSFGVSFYNCQMPVGAIVVASGSKFNFLHGTKIDFTLSPSSGDASAVLNFIGARLTGLMTCNDTWNFDGGCVIDRLNNNGLNIASGSVNIDNSKFIVRGGSSKYAIKLTAGSLSIKNSYVGSLGSGGIGLSIVLLGIVALDASNSVFEAPTLSDDAVSVDSAYTDAPFYNCAFKGGTTNLTAAAGTANGTNVSF